MVLFLSLPPSVVELFPAKQFGEFVDLLPRHVEAEAEGEADLRLAAVFYVLPELLQGHPGLIEAVQVPFHAEGLEGVRRELGEGLLKVPLQDVPPLPLGGDGDAVRVDLDVAVTLYADDRDGVVVPGVLPVPVLFIVAAELAPLHLKDPVVEPECQLRAFDAQTEIELIQFSDVHWHASFVETALSRIHRHYTTPEPPLHLLKLPKNGGPICAFPKKRKISRNGSNMTFTRGGFCAILFNV
jgi:hypothetical protein